MFENISKGEFYTRKLIDKDSSFEIDFKNDHASMNTLAYTANVDVNVSEEKQNAKFVAYCFNLQQKYDISKFEECVKMLEKSIEINKAHGFNGHLINNQIEQLLKQVVK